MKRRSFPLTLTEPETALIARRQVCQIFKRMKSVLKIGLINIPTARQKEKREKLAALRAVPANESLVVVTAGKYIGEDLDELRLVVHQDRK